LTEHPTKPCRLCGTVLPLASFYRNKRMIDGHVNECPACLNDRKMQTVDQRAYSLLSHAQSRARQKKLRFEITREWVKERLCRGVCEATGVHLHTTTTTRHDPYGPSLDRLDPTQGYTQENTRLVAWGYNRLKHVTGEAAAQAFLRDAAGCGAGR
jgi:hypothetical protein